MTNVNNLRFVCKPYTERAKMQRHLILNMAVYTEMGADCLDVLVRGHPPKNFGGGGAYQPLYTSLALSFTFLNLFQNLSYSKSLLPGAELPS